MSSLVPLSRGDRSEQAVSLAAHARLPAPAAALAQAAAEAQVAGVSSAAVASVTGIPMSEVPCYLAPWFLSNLLKFSQGTCLPSIAFRCSVGLFRSPPVCLNFRNQFINICAKQRISQTRLQVLQVVLRSHDCHFGVCMLTAPVAHLHALKSRQCLV